MRKIAREQRKDAEKLIGRPRAKSWGKNTETKPRQKRWSEE